jgi:hypothetical protein
MRSTPVGDCLRSGARLPTFPEFGRISPQREGGEGMGRVTWGPGVTGGVKKPRAEASPKHRARVRKIVTRNVERLRKYGGRVSGGARLNVRVDRIRAWFSRDGVIEILAGTGGAVLFSANKAEVLGQMRATPMVNHLSTEQAYVEVTFPDFSRDEPPSEVVWERRARSGLNQLGGEVFVATEAAFREVPEDPKNNEEVLSQ